jgi:LPXTG-motif cell wall-anchored protein
MGASTDFGRRAAAVLAAAAAVLTAAATATPVGAQAPATTETSLTATTVPDTTIPDDDTSTTIGTSPEGPATDTTVADVGPTSTLGVPPTSAPTTNTTVPTGPWPERECTDYVMSHIEYVFEVVDDIEAGDTFDDPDSDFSVTFTRVDLVGDHLEVDYDTNLYVPQVLLNAGGQVHMMAFFWNPDEGPLGGPHTAVMSAHHGTDLQRARFCFDAAESIGAPVPEPPVTATTLQGASPVEEAPAVDAAPSPTVTVAASAVTGGAALPKTGNDALPVALAGAGLVAVGGGLLLGRRLRRT